MKAVRLHLSGGPEALVYEDALKPYPGVGEVLIQVHAVAVTPTEFSWYPTWNTKTGEARPLPIILGHEFSGVVAAVGPDVTDLSEGAEVYGINDWFRDGAQAEYCIARASDLAPKPASIDHLQASAVPISALTAWQGLFERANVGIGKRVLIHGAAGGVGNLAVQLAHYRGAYVIARVSAHNIDFVRELGANEIIDYKAMRFDDVVKDVDVVFDTVGGETLQRSWNVLKQGGNMITIAADSERAVNSAAKEAFFIVEPNRTQLIEIARLIDAGNIRPIVDAVFPLAQARNAYEHKPIRGKVVLRVID
jgi:NADPH:quinone reductase-like Zn-dependent oxidoreductase